MVNLELLQSTVSKVELYEFVYLSDEDDNQSELDMSTLKYLLRTYSVGSIRVQ